MATGIGVSISSPAASGGVIWVDRRLTVSGTVTLFQGSIDAMSIIFPGGVSFTVRPPPARGFGQAGGNWSWTGLIPNTVLAGETFAITVSLDGRFIANDSEHTETPAGGQRSLTLWLLPVTPKLAVDPFQTPQVTSGATLPITLSGTVTEGPAGTATGCVVDPYAPRVQYQIGSAAPVAVPVNSGTWKVDLNLAPGQYPIVVTAQDDFNGRDEVRKTLTVYHYDRPADDPALPKTLAGVSTSASVTSWTRLEPRCAGADVTVTSAARLFDPLWLMTRQWQVGEFQGEDAGTPIQARVRATTGSLSRYHAGELTPGDLVSLRYAPNQAPLEAIAERRATRPVRTTDLRMLPVSIDAGLHLMRMLELDPVGAKYRQAFLTRYPLVALTPQQVASTDAEAVRLMTLAAGRAPDARALFLALSTARQPTPFTFEAALGVSAADAPALQKVIVAWLNIYLGLFLEPAGEAWIPERLEYALSTATRLSAAAGDDVTLSAAEFDGGRMDWSSFDVNDQLKLDTVGDRSFTAMTAVAVPAPVTIKGAPAPRFWEMEDAKVAYGLLPVGPTDLGSLMMFEYAHSYGNDWFVVPLTLPVGSVTRIGSLVVTDTFGVRSLLRPIGDPGLPDPCFSMWQLSRLRRAGAEKTRPVAGLFFLPPALGGVIDGPILEDVLFMRDEMANLAWGIERTVEGGAGTAVSLATGMAPDVAPPSAGAQPRYRLTSPVADNWVPLLPTGVDDTGAVRLRRAATLQADGSQKVRVARSAALNAAASLALFDEEVPREGVRITRRRRLARWIDGYTVLWTAFRNEVGNGEGSAGLLFDQVQDPLDG